MLHKKILHAIGVIVAMITSVGEVSANEVETADSIATQHLNNVTVTAVKSKAKLISLFFLQT